MQLSMHNVLSKSAIMCVRGTGMLRARNKEKNRRITDDAPDVYILSYFTWKNNNWREMKVIRNAKYARGLRQFERKRLEHLEEISSECLLRQLNFCYPIGRRDITRTRIKGKCLIASKRNQSAQNLREWEEQQKRSSTNGSSYGEYVRNKVK
jgi:hypothetical protein